MVFLKSHPGHIVNCVTVNAFIVRHFTGSQVGEKDNVQIFSLSRSALGFLMEIKYFQ